MTWRELFRRAWLVLRLWRKTFRVCPTCGVPLLAVIVTEYRVCNDCWELERLVARKEIEENHRRFMSGLPSGPTIGELAALQHIACAHHHTQTNGLPDSDPHMQIVCCDCHKVMPAAEYNRDRQERYWKQTQVQSIPTGANALGLSAIGSAIDASGLGGIFS